MWLFSVTLVGHNCSNGNLIMFYDVIKFQHSLEHFVAQPRPFLFVACNSNLAKKMRKIGVDSLISISMYTFADFFYCFHKIACICFTAMSRETAAQFSAIVIILWFSDAASNNTIVQRQRCWRELAGDRQESHFTIFLFENYAHFLLFLLMSYESEQNKKRSDPPNN